jgi:hypothetical protein
LPALKKISCESEKCLARVIIGATAGKMPLSLRKKSVILKRADFIQKVSLRGLLSRKKIASWRLLRVI